MTDQEYRNIQALKALDYVRALSSVLVDEIEKGFPVSERTLDKIAAVERRAIDLAIDADLAVVFEGKTQR